MSAYKGLTSRNFPTWPAAEGQAW